MQKTIEYKVHEDGIHLLTDCPYGNTTERGYVIKVGSGSCRECPKFISDNFIDKVLCKNE